VSAAPAARRLRLVQPYPGWEAVYRDNVTRIYRAMLARTGSRPDAEDLTARVFLTALPSPRITASQPEASAYLASTARTVLAAHWRATFGLEVTAIDVSELEATLAGPGASAAAGADRRARARAEAILAQLPDRYRAVLELRFLRGYSLREAARELGVSVSNAGVLQHRALRMAASLPEPGPGER
jgi:RNA polymerase sigma factor (sigma-70 family)